MILRHFIRGCSQIHSPTRTFSALLLWLFLDISWRIGHTLSTFMVQCRIVKIIPSSQPFWLSPECNGDHIHHLDILWPFLSHILLRVTFTMSGSVTTSNSGFQMSDIPLQLPASATASSNDFALVTFSQAGSDLMQNVHSLRPIAIQTRPNLWQLQHPIAYPQSVLAVLGPQEAVQLVTHWAQEALNDQREKARRALLCQQGEFLAATHQYEAVARQNFVNTLTRNNEAHNHDVPMKVRQLEHEADAWFSKRQRELFTRLCPEANQALENQPEILVMEVTSGVWRRDEHVHYFQTELSPHALHPKGVTQHQSQEWTSGLHQHFTGLVQETQQHREMFEESRALHPATRPEIEQIQQREAELLRELRQQNNARTKCEALLLRNQTDLESHEPRTSEDQQSSSRFTPRSFAVESIRCATESHQRSWGKDLKSKDRDS